MYKIFFLILIVICILVTGCDSNTLPAEASNGGIYLNGNRIDSINMVQYIEMAKLYWQEVYSLGDTPELLEIENEEQIVLEISFQSEYEKAKKYLEYSEEEWEREYYRTIIKKDQLYSKFSIKEQIDLMVNVYADEALNTGEITYIDESKISISEVFMVFEDKYGLTYKDFIENVFKPFIQSLSEDENLLGYFADQIYTGNKIQFNIKNKDEYISYLIDLNSEYEKYIEDLLEQTEITVN